MAVEPWIDVALFRYSTLPNEGWDRGKWDQAHWDGGLAADGNWTSIVCDVRGLDIARGKRNVTVEGGVEAGICTFDLDNRDGRWSEFVDVSVDQDGSAYVPALTAGVGVRVTSSDGTTTRVHFSGTIERWKQTWSTVDDVVHVTAVDGWADFVQQAQVPWTPGPPEGVASRMRRLLNRAGWSFTAGPQDDTMRPAYLQDGSISCLGSVLVNYIETGLVVRGSVADEILRTAQSDGGKAFLDGDGSFVYLNRGWATPGAGPPAITPTIAGHPTRAAQSTVPLFGDWCDTPGAGELPYSDLDWDYDGTASIGTAIVASTDAQRVSDTAGNVLPTAWESVGATVAAPAGRPVQTFGELRLSTQAEADALAAFYLDTYRDAYVSCRRLQVYPPLDPRLWDIALGLRLGDHVQVLRRERRNTLLMEAVVEGVGLRITPEPWRAAGGHHYGAWLFDFTTSPAQTFVSSTPALDLQEHAA